MKPKKAPKRIVNIVLSLLCAVIVSVFPGLFMFFSNAGEASFSEISGILMYFALFSLGIFVIALLLTRSCVKAGVISALSSLIFLNFAPIESAVRLLAPASRYWHVLPVCFFVVALCSYFVWKKIPEDLLEIITMVLAGVFCGLIIMNGAFAAPAILARQQTEREMAERKPPDPVTNAEKHPNIYYLIFDEYSSVDFMKKYYDYDNSALIDHLQQKEFNVSLTSKNASILTTVVTTQLVNLDYTADNTWESHELQLLRENGALFSLLREQGYTLSGAGDAALYGLPSAVGAVDRGSETVSGESMADLLIKRTPLYILYASDYPKDAQEILKSIDYMKDPNNHTGTNRFTLCHLNIPHQPFIFDKNGNLNRVFSNNWEDQDYYRNQYIFATTTMEEIVDSIIADDPDSVIILQSDHSARAYGDLFFKMFPLEDMRSILNAVYFRGEPLEIEGLSGVNTLRTLCNALFAAEYEMVNDPVDTYYPSANVDG